MEPEILTDKFDQINEADLGIPFDQNLLWEKLNERMTASKHRSSGRLLLVACFTLLVLLIPITLLKQNSESSIAESDGQVAEIQEIVSIPQVQSVDSTRLEVKKNQPIHQVVKKGINENMTASVPVAGISPAMMFREAEIERENLFTQKDISIIQASLEEPKIGFEKRGLIRAQLSPPSDVLKVDYQKLKIKLYANDK
ncbi:MAG: hypothetical protein RIM99_17625 [Cyclobacteriaceae bacterium]